MAEDQYMKLAALYRARSTALQGALTKGHAILAEAITAYNTVVNESVRRVGRIDELINQLVAEIEIDLPAIAECPTGEEVTEPSKPSAGGDGDGDGDAA